MSQKILIIGYGKMGKVHAKYLTAMGINWDYVDSNISHKEIWPKYLNFYTHIIIATPIDTHAEIYNRLCYYAGFILIEKPVVVQRNCLNILKDIRVMAGLNERYNPVTQYLKDVGGIIKKIEFYRDGGGSFRDVAIHDIDIAFQIFGCEYEITKFDISKIEARFGQIPVSFQCRQDRDQARYALVTFYNGVTVADFKTQQINDAPLQRCSTIQKELIDFLGEHGSKIHPFGEDEWDSEPIAYHSHKFLVECLEHGVS